MQSTSDNNLRQLAEKYFTNRPSRKLKIVDVEIPCGTSCLKETEYKELLNNNSFREQLEIIDSLESLINDKIDELIEELRFRFSEYDVDHNNLAYSIFKIIEYGGNIAIGEKITYEGRLIFSGDFKRVYELSKRIEETIRDQNIKSICDEIKYLSESLWVHFDKNLRRILDEI